MQEGHVPQNKGGSQTINTASRLKVRPDEIFSEFVASMTRIKRSLSPPSCISHDSVDVAPITDHLAILVVASFYLLCLVVESPKLQGISVAATGLFGFTELTNAKELPALSGWSLVRLANCSLARAAGGSLQRVLPVIASRETGRSWTLAEHRLEKSPSPETLLRRPLPLTSRNYDPPGADQDDPAVYYPCRCCESEGEEGAYLDLLFFAGSAVDFWRFPGQLRLSPTLRRPLT